MIRAASALLLVALALLLNVVLWPSGASAIAFSFIGMPLGLAGIVLALLKQPSVETFVRRLRGSAGQPPNQEKR